VYSQGSDEPLLTHRYLQNARVPAEPPRLEEAQLKFAKIAVSHGYPQIQLARELE
jgi:hypothetical protein